MSVCGHVGKNVCLNVLLFDGLSVHPFVCSYTVLCMFLSICLSTSSNIICTCARPSVRVSVRPPECIFLCDIVYDSISLNVFFPFVRPSERSSVLSYSVRMIMHACKSRKENPQKLTQLSSRSHPRHLVGKRTAQKDTIIDITSDSQVNSNFPYRWSPASLTFNNYFYLFSYLYIT